VLVGSVVGGIAGLLLLNLIVLPILMFAAVGGDIDGLSDSELRRSIHALHAWPWVYAGSGFLLGALAGFVAARLRASEPLHVALFSGLLLAAISTVTAVARSTPFEAVTIAYTILIVLGAVAAAAPHSRRAV